MSAAGRLEKTQAILIRKSRLAETSLICTWITQEAGKVRTAARGALRPGTALYGKLDLFFEADIAFAPSPSGDLHSLREVVLVAPFDQQGTQYANLATASYFGELIDATTEPLAPMPEVYGLLGRAVRFLRHGPPSIRVIEFFESELAKALGVHDAGGREDPLLSLASLCSRIPPSRARLIRILKDP